MMAAVSTCPSASDSDGYRWRTLHPTRTREGAHHGRGWDKSGRLPSKPRDRLMMTSCGQKHLGVGWMEGDGWWVGQPTALKLISSWSCCWIAAYYPAGVSAIPSRRQFVGWHCSRIHFINRSIGSRSPCCWRCWRSSGSLHKGRQTISIINAALCWDVINFRVYLNILQDCSLFLLVKIITMNYVFFQHIFELIHFDVVWLSLLYSDRLCQTVSVVGGIKKNSPA